MTAAAAVAAAVAVLVAVGPARSVTPARRPVGRSAPGPDFVEPVRRLGRAARRIAGRPPDPVADQRLGFALLLVATMVLVDPVLPVLAGGAAALVLRWRRARRRRPSPDDDLVQALPEVIDLLALAVGAGHTVAAALPIVARRAPPAARDGLVEADAAIRDGQRVVEALDSLHERWGEPARPLLRAVRDHVRHGTPLAPSLDRLSAEARATRRRAAETRARRLPVLLLFPLVFCTLPAFGLLTVAPIVAGTLRSLDGERLETGSVSSTERSENHPCPPSSSPSRSQRCPPSSDSSTTAASGDAMAASPRPSTPSSCSAPPPWPSCS